MIIDFVFLILMIIAIWKGFKKGLVVAVFSLLAFVIGIAAALKFSAIVAGWLGNQISVAQQWLPILSFALVFIGVAFFVRLGAKMIEKTLQFALLGWVNKIGGMLFFVILYLFIFSVVLFYANQLKLLNQNTIIESKIYAYVLPLGQKVIDGIGVVVPIFKNLFSQLEAFFDRIKTTKP